MEIFEKRTFRYMADGSRVDMYEGVEIRKQNEAGGLLHPQNQERPIIQYFHDECIFWANDGQSTFWGTEVLSRLLLLLNQIIDFLQHDNGMAKKGQGQGLMISDFICEEIGYLKLTEEQKKLPEASRLTSSSARVVFEYGKNRSGYRGNEHFQKQLENAIAIHNIPACTSTFHCGQFIWTSCCAFAPNALKAEKMSVNPGGKQPILRKTFWNGKEQIIGNRGLKEV
eukprot:Pompholyxophrys_punicea_v1_NODE_242_length_2578_cov_11.424891.p1 type:complete len:226 gc:universal NODE_242_length_2578_cov_11.424891:1589-912(-)